MAQVINLRPVSNREDWDETFELIGEDDTALDLSAVTELTLKLWDPESRAILLSGGLGAGVSIDDIAGGVISIHVAAAAMQALAPKSYPFRLGMVNGGATKDLATGTLPIQDGGPI